MEHGTGVTQRVTFDSPIGQLGLVVTPNGLRQVLLPRTARRSSASAAPAATANAAPTATANAATANARATTPRIADAVGQVLAYLRGERREFDPCHRVVAADGLGGYGGGLALKRRLLRLEGALAEQLSLIGDYQE